MNIIFYTWAAVLPDNIKIYIFTFCGIFSGRVWGHDQIASYLPHTNTHTYTNTDNFVTSTTMERSRCRLSSAVVVGSSTASAVVVVAASAARMSRWEKDLGLAWHQKQSTQVQKGDWQVSCLRQFSCTTMHLSGQRWAICCTDGSRERMEDKAPAL